MPSGLLVVFTGVVLGATPTSKKMKIESKENPNRSIAEPSWDARDGTLVGELSGHTRPVKSLAFSPTSRRLVSASRDGTARVWDIETRSAVAVLNHGSWVNDAVFSRDGNWSSMRRSVAFDTPLE
jgi:WD40 repeat protein